MTLDLNAGAVYANEARFIAGCDSIGEPFRRWRHRTGKFCKGTFSGSFLFCLFAIGLHAAFRPVSLSYQHPRPNLQSGQTLFFALHHPRGYSASETYRDGPLPLQLEYR